MSQENNDLDFTIKQIPKAGDYSKTEEKVDNVYAQLNKLNEAIKIAGGLTNKTELKKLLLRKKELEQTINVVAKDEKGEAEPVKSFEDVHDWSGRAAI